MLVPGSVLKVEPGLSAYADKPQDALMSLVPLMKHASAHIPTTAQKAARLMVLATAGLRMVPELKSQAILKTLAQGLPEKCQFQVRRDDVRIISGVEEGRCTGCMILCRDTCPRVA